MNKLKLLSVLALFTFVYACGGGGGSAPPKETPVDPKTLEDYVIPPQTPLQSSQSYQTKEYKKQYGLTNINAADIYAKGYFGDDVIVAVIDSGVDIDHPDLIDNIAPGGYDFIDDDDDATPIINFEYIDDKGITQNYTGHHGTHVAGIIAAMKDSVGMHGVAYNAKILPFRVEYFNDTKKDFYFKDDYIRKAYAKAITQGAKVINNSWGRSDNFNDYVKFLGGTNSDFYKKRRIAYEAKNIQSFFNASNANIIQVFAAGNQSKDKESTAEVSLDAFTPGLVDQKDKLGKYYTDIVGSNAADFEKLKQTMIVVVATDKDNKIADFSYRCGEAKMWCMAAPGVDIYSTIVPTNTTNYDKFSGTSMAAPHVSGAVAVLRSKWPNIAAEEITTIIYDTATDLGVAGVDAIYGRGLLNLSEALKPQGKQSIPTPSGQSFNVNDSSIAANSILGDSLTKSFAITMLDKYKRNYQINLNNSVQTAQANNNLNEINYIDDDTQINTSESLKFFVNNKQGAIHLQKNYNNLELSLAHKQNPAQVFARQNNVSGVSAHYSLYGKSHLSNINNAATINIASKGDIKTSIGTTFGYADTNNEHSITATSLSFALGSTKDLSLTAQFSKLQEKDTFLSNYFSGAYQTGASSTNAINLTAKYKLASNLSFITQYNTAKTKVQNASNSIIQNISTISSNGYSLSLAKNNVGNNNATLFVSFKRPLKVTNGSMTVATAASINTDNSINFTNKKIALTPSGNERQITLGYSTDYAKDAAFTLLLNHRKNPNHSAATKDENSVIMKMRLNF